MTMSHEIRGRDVKRTYTVIGPGKKIPPSYDRVARGMNDVELADEIAGGKGDHDYRAALREEQARRRKV